MCSASNSPSESGQHRLFCLLFEVFPKSRRFIPLWNSPTGSSSPNTTVLLPCLEFPPKLKMIFDQSVLMGKHDCGYRLLLAQQLIYTRLGSLPNSRNPFDCSRTRAEPIPQPMCGRRGQFVPCPALPEIIMCASKHFKCILRWGCGVPGCGRLLS